MTRNAGRYSIQHISAAIRDFFKGWGKWGVGAVVKETFLASKSCSLATPVEYTHLQLNRAKVMLATVCM